MGTKKGWIKSACLLVALLIVASLTGCATTPQIDEIQMKADQALAQAKKAEVAPEGGGQHPHRLGPVGAGSLLDEGQNVLGGQLCEPHRSVLIGCSQELADVADAIENGWLGMAAHRPQVLRKLAYLPVDWGQGRHRRRRNPPRLSKGGQQMSQDGTRVRARMRTRATPVPTEQRFTPRLV